MPLTCEFLTDNTENNIPNNIESRRLQQSLGLKLRTYIVRKRKAWLDTKGGAYPLACWYAMLLSCSKSWKHITPTQAIGNAQLRVCLDYELEVSYLRSNLLNLIVLIG